LEPFSDEHVYLVGSTAEDTKLRWSTNDGDCDFIFLSGKLVIPVDNIVPKEGSEDYIWIKSDNLNSDKFAVGANVVYLSPEMLKTVSTELFTILRGLYNIITSTNDSTPERVGTALGSKVGLATEEYVNLEIEGLPNEPLLGDKTDTRRRKSYREKLKQRVNTIVVNNDDRHLLRRIVQLLGNIEFPGSRGKLPYISALARATLARSPNEAISDSEDALDTDEEHWPTRNLKATFDIKRSMDFVPALRVQGRLPCLDTFIQRVQHTQWPGVKLGNELCEKEVFIVARLGPISPDRDKDFRLSFNLAEIVLVQNLPVNAKSVFIVLKSLLKGLIRCKFKEHSLKNKLRSYHMKTIMFWVCEDNPLEFWSENSMTTAIDEVLQYLKNYLIEKRLEHYFIRSNLFLDFEESDYNLLSDCVSILSEDPLGGIGVFFNMDAGVKAETILTPEEVKHLVKVRRDGGRRKIVDHIEDAEVDFIRGFNESTRNKDGNAPIKEAVLCVVDMFLKDEKNYIRKIPTFLVSPLIVGVYFGSPWIARLYGCYKGETRFKVFVEFICSKISRKRLEEAARKDQTEHIQSFRQAIEKFLSCSRDMEKQAELNIQVDMFVYFAIKKLCYTKMEEQH